jgi:uncharacterized protein (DUF58 family)
MSGTGADRPRRRPGRRGSRPPGESPPAGLAGTKSLRPSSGAAGSPTANLRLAPPAARQGPGPMPPPLLDALAPAINARASRLLPGDHRAPGAGAGTELARLRPYETSDDVRFLDAAASARTGQPHVRLHVPERTLTTWIVLDVSPSMAFGTARRLKSDVAEGVALAIGRLAVRHAGALGVVTFGAGGVAVLPPRSSRPALIGLQRMIDAGVAKDREVDAHALEHALRKVEALSRRAGLVAVISDLRDQEGWERPLRALRHRHAVLAIEVSDPREQELPNAGRLAVIDPETGERIEVDTSHRRVRERFAELEAQRRAEVHAELRRARAVHVPLSTGGDWLLELGRALR